MPVMLTLNEFYFYLALAFLAGGIITAALLGHPVTDRFIGWMGGAVDTEWDADPVAETVLQQSEAAGPSNRPARTNSTEAEVEAPHVFDGSKGLDW